MNCNEIKPNLSAFLDGEAIGLTRVEIDDHLSGCAVCSGTLAEFREIRRRIRQMPRPVVPSAVVHSLRNAVSVQFGTRPDLPLFASRPPITALRVWVVSYGVGAFASMVLGMSFIWLLSHSIPGPGTSSVMNDRADTGRISTLVNPGPEEPDDALSAIDFARSRVSIAPQSPSVNPHGSLIELTRSLVNGELRDDEVVVVADVYKNGTAAITEVVEPSRDASAVGELAKALKADPQYQPFVPALLDQRSDLVRVVLKIQSIDVSTRERPRKRKLSS